MQSCPRRPINRPSETLGDLPANAPIPSALLLDCRQELRWVQGEATEMQAFNHAAKVLRVELRSRVAVEAQPVVPGPSRTLCAREVQAEPDLREAQARRCRSLLRPPGVST